MKQFSWQKLLIGLALAAGCMLVGAAIPTTNQALGEVSGGRRSHRRFKTARCPCCEKFQRRCTKWMGAWHGWKRWPKRCQPRPRSVRSGPQAPSPLTKQQLDRERLEEVIGYQLSAISQKLLNF